VILTTPPGFRSYHFEEAVKQGKHIFMEKPVATDPAGIQRVLAAAQIAKQKKLNVVVGLQRHYQNSYRELFKRKGQIGDITSAQVWWNNDGVWVHPREPQQTEMEYQMRNWYYFNWICGDHICEQHVHNLDVSNWFKGGKHPVKALGMGGRTQRVGKQFGEIYDHFGIEYTYEDGTIMNSQSRHWNGVASRVSETIIGTKGSAFPGMIKDRSGKVVWRFKGQDNNPYQTEHERLYDFIRKDEAHNDAYYTAESTLTAIMGRMAAYTGKEVTWEQALNSSHDTMPKVLSWDADPGPKAGPDGMYPCPIPGQGSVA
ncbi:MAG: Gfo/Idh/MocA family oxidoreductase, partial [Verrucomicrobiaceae bacterium]